MDDVLNGKKHVKRIFEEASLDKKIEYLFDGISALHEESKQGFEQMDNAIKEMKAACECRKNGCTEVFVTKKQGRIFGIMLAIFAAGVGIGSGTIAWFELIKIAKP